MEYTETDFEDSVGLYKSMMDYIDLKLGDIKTKMEALAAEDIAYRQFSVAILKEFMENYSDIGGDFIQEQAVKSGLLVEVTATEPCCDNKRVDCCACAALGFPISCCRPSPILKAALTQDDDVG
jgi:hypothetical protein